MKNIFIFSGVGVISVNDNYNLLQNNTTNWGFFENFLQVNTLSELQIYCIKTFAVQISLYELWENWGVTPDIILGFSLGEVAACCISGLINLFDAVEIILNIAKEVEKENGWLCHGYDLNLVENTFNSSLNFKEENKIHSTVCGLNESFENFQKNNPDCKKMHVKNPWHHEVYNKNIIIEIPNQNKCKTELYLTSTTNLTTKLEEDHWVKWLFTKSNMINTITNLQQTHPNEVFNIIEIGAHPVMDQMVSALPVEKYITSMNRDVNHFDYIMEKREMILDELFIELIKSKCTKFDKNIIFEKSLLLQDYNSLKLTKLASLLQTYFPNFGPQDLYKHDTIDNIISHYGKGTKCIDSNIQYNNINDEPIVIAGASCILPYDIYDMNNLWEKLMDGFDGIRTIEKFDDLPCGYIDDLYFDHDKFKISKKEAESMDPQQILTLILSDLLFKDSSIKKEDLWGSKTGVYIGSWNLDYEGNKSSAYYAIGKNPSIISARINSQYNLLGPSKVINTACSASLECLNDAIKDIKLGITDFAIVGGVNMLWSKDFTHAMQKSKFLGKSGRCKTFDNSADGYVRSEGGGLILIGRKSKIDKYYAEIIGGATNHNGYSPLLTVPNSEAQTRVILDACKSASINPNEIDYIECHGTGTKIGDPIEVSGLKEVIHSQRQTPCYLGSIKSNIGHLESGAGIAGIIKSILVLVHQTIPRNIHISEINKNLNLHDGLQIVENNMKSDINIIGVSSFGFGGSNGHILLKKSDNVKSIHSIHYEKRKEYYVLKRQTKEVNNIYNQMSGIIKTENFEIEEIDQNRLHFNTLVNEIGVNNKYDIPLIHQDLDSLTLTEFIIQIENKYSYEIDIADMSDQQLTCNDIYNRIYKINKPVPRVCTNTNEPRQPIDTPIKHNKPKTLEKEPIITKKIFNYYHYTKIRDPSFKIKTTHVGSLPRGKNDTAKTVMEKQLDIGIDIINDGEIGRKSYAEEILNSLTGFEDNLSIGPQPKDLKECSGCSRRFIAKTGLITLNTNVQTLNPACTGPITYTNLLNVQHSLNDYLTSLKINGVRPEDSFYSVPSPGTLSIFFHNKYYENDDIYLSELSKHLKIEYEEIASHNVNLQIDCPDLAMGRHTKYQHLSEREFLLVVKKHIYYLNKALENIDSDKIRMHICWGNYSAPHNFDINLEAIVSEIFKAKPTYILLESANHVHNYDIEIFKRVKFPEDKKLVLGLIDTSSQHIETPNLIAKRIIEAANIVGKDNIMAGTDCGFATTSDSSGIVSEVAWLKLQNLVKGANIATRMLSNKNVFQKRPIIRVYEFGNTDLLNNDIDQIEIRKVPNNFSTNILIEHLKNYVDIPIVYLYDKENEKIVQNFIKKIENSRYYPNEVIEFDDNANNIIKNLIDKYSIIDENKLIVNNTTTLENTYDVVVIGAGINGLYVTNKLINEGLKVCLLEKDNKIGGVWNTYANFTSQVNSSEASYRFIDDTRKKINKDHTTPREIVEDVNYIKEQIQSNIFTNHEVTSVEKNEDNYNILIKNGVKIESKGVIFAINDRVGIPREVTWPKQDEFQGKIINGYGKDVNNIDFENKRVVIVGMGAFATENMRTALESGAKQVTILCRRKGTVCPKYIEYINFINKTGNESDLLHNSVENTNNMVTWRKLYEKSGAKQPECWPANIKHYGHTISVSDLFFIGHYLGLIEIVTDEIKEFYDDGVVTFNNDKIEADLIIKCTGFERNASMIPKLTQYKETNSINYLDDNFMYLADALIDDNVFNSIFGSSVIEMVKFFTEVYIHFFHNPEECKKVQDKLHTVDIENRKWSDYIAGTQVLFENNESLNEVVKTQLAKRHNNFINAHNVEDFKRENKREWIEINKILSYYSKNLTTLEYPDW